MTAELQHIRGVPVLLCDPDGAVVAGERDATDLIGDAMGAGASLVAIPIERLSPEFLDLGTRLAGGILQKFVNYRLRVAILGDISVAVEGSGALRDFVRESNRGLWVWFVADLAALEEKLAEQA